MENPSIEKKPTPIMTAVIVLVLLAAAGLRVKDAFLLRRVIWARMSLHDASFAVEVADTAAKREKGLGGRSGIAGDHGMYFPFPEARAWVFWMKGMRFPIDIVWIREGKVIDITSDVPVDPGLPLKTYSPVDPADAVLELQAGTARRIGLQRGDAAVLAVSPDGS